MHHSESRRAGRAIPVWIVAGVALLAGGVGSAAVLSASQFLTESGRLGKSAPVVAATVLPGPDRFMPEGLVREAPPSIAVPSPAPMRALAKNDPRFGAPSTGDSAGPFDAIAATDEANEGGDGAVTLASLVEEPSKPTKAVKAVSEKAKADDKPKAAKAKVTGRSVTNDDVNIRAGASSRSAVIGVVPANTSVDIVKCASWCEIAYDGKRGYIYSGFLGHGGAKAKAAAPALADAKASTAKVKTSVTLQPKKKWSLFGKKDSGENAAEAPTPAFN